MTAATPEQEAQILKFRAKELGSITGFLQERASNTHDKLLFVCGGCGAGKTSCLKIVERNYPSLSQNHEHKGTTTTSASSTTTSTAKTKGAGMHFVYVDCAGKTPSQLLQPILDKLRKCLPKNRVNKADHKSSYSVLRHQDDDDDSDEELLTNMSKKTGQPQQSKQNNKHEEDEMLAEIADAACRMAGPLCVALDEADRFCEASKCARSRLDANAPKGTLPSLVAALCSTAAAVHEHEGGDLSNNSNKVALVLVSNNRGLTEKMPHGQVSELTFEPYSTEQLKEIMQNEFAQSNSNKNVPAGETIALRSEAAEYVAKRVAGTDGGDARKIVAAAANAFEHYQRKRCRRQEEGQEEHSNNSNKDTRRQQQKATQSSAVAEEQRQQQVSLPTTSLGIAQVSGTFHDAQTYTEKFEQMPSRMLVVLGCCVYLATTTAPSTRGVCALSAASVNTTQPHKRGALAKGKGRVGVVQVATGSRNTNSAANNQNNICRSITVREVHLLYLQLTASKDACNVAAIGLTEIERAVQSLADTSLLTTPTLPLHGSANANSHNNRGGAFTLTGRPCEYVAALKLSGDKIGGSHRTAYDAATGGGK